MGQYQATPAAGTGQKSSALGKRKPLSELSTNEKPRPKRQRPPPSSYHGEESSHERSTKVPSLRQPSSSTPGAAVCDEVHKSNRDSTDDEAGEERWKGSTEVQTLRQLGHTASVATINDENLDPTDVPSILGRVNVKDVVFVT